VAKEHAHTTGVQIWGLGRKDAHWGGLAVVRDSAVGKTSTTVRTMCHRRRLGVGEERGALAVLLAVAAELEEDGRRPSMASSHGGSWQ
jgi:hypothetical protein